MPFEYGDEMIRVDSAEGNADIAAARAIQVMRALLRSGLRRN